MNEELQSTNEELATVNEELKNKVDQLGRVNSDLQNFIEGTQVPTIFLDNRMRRQKLHMPPNRCSASRIRIAAKLLSDVVSRADQKLIETLVRGVIETNEPIERELSIDDDRECATVLRVLPYRDAGGGIERGVILVFSDVTGIRQTQADLARNVSIARQRSDEIETLYKTAPVGMALIDCNQRYLKINQHFADLTGYAIDEHIGRTLYEMAPLLAERMAGDCRSVRA